MRLLLVSDIPSFTPSGVPTETRTLARGLIARGHSVALLSDGPLPVDGLERYRLDIGHAGRYASQLVETMDHFKPQVVHIVSMGSTGLLKVEPTLRQLPWAFTCHNPSPFEKRLYGMHDSDTVHYAIRGLRFLPNTLAWRWIFQSGRLPCVIVHSEQVQDTVRRYGSAESSIALIPLGVGLPSSGKRATEVHPNSTPRILTVGGMAHTKGLHHALEAVAWLRKEFAGLHYDLLGEVRDPGYVAFLEQRIVSLGLSGHAALHCNAPDSLKAELTQTADLYLQPSHEEGFCLAFAEAAPRVPRLVGTRTGAIAAMCCDDPLARCVEPRRPEDLGDAMSQLLHSEVPPNALAQRRERLAARFSWDRYLESHEALYRRLVN